MEKIHILQLRPVSLVAILVLVAILSVFSQKSAASEDVDELVAGTNEFAFDLYHQLASDAEGGNMVLSPYSISLVMAIACAGARELTRNEIEDTMHFTLPAALWLSVFNSLDENYAHAGNIALFPSNLLWIEQDYSSLLHYTNVLDAHSPAGMRSAAFKDNPEEARVMINDLVRSQTQEKIYDIIPPGGVDESTRLVPVSAVYFNTEWQTWFDPDATEDMPFRLIDGGQVMVPMMQVSATFQYHRGMDYAAIEILYSGAQLSMVVIMPNSGVFEQVEDSLSCLTVNDIIGRMSETQVDLVLPRFRMDSWYSLHDTLASMGIIDAFCEECANFEGISDTDELYLHDVFHEVVLEIDEDGTEAPLIAGESSGSAATFRADHPFIFVIRDTETGAMLFIGRMMDPSDS